MGGRGVLGIPATCVPTTTNARKLATLTNIVATALLLSILGLVVWMRYSGEIFRVEVVCCSRRLFWVLRVLGGSVLASERHVLGGVFRVGSASGWVLRARWHFRSGVLR